ncbi:TMEM175 family protein [Rhodococcus sp. GXMU-t2271]|uniref:TMEM175 family protein n=1 Tax=Rhodococcus sp. GXMU-t2271 TaxID=3059079 RepID=UPI003529E757
MTEPRERARSFERYLTFLDAIVAIAITLLVLPLVDRASDHEGTTIELLHDAAGALGAFALSFVVIFRFWWGQHRLVRDIVADDPWVDRALFLWVFTIIFLPFPSALVATNSDETATRALYIGTMAASGAALMLSAWAAGRHPAITAGAAPPDLAGTVALTALLLVALVLSVTVPPLSYYPLLLLLLSSPLTRLVRRGRHPSGARVRSPIGAARRPVIRGDDRQSG